MGSTIKPIAHNKSIQAKYNHVWDLSMKIAFYIILALQVSVQPSVALCSDGFAKTAVLLVDTSSVIALTKMPETLEAVEKRIRKLSFLVQSLQESDNAPFSVGLEFGCTGRCIFDGREQGEYSSIGNINIFPTLANGETRRLELLLDSADIPSNADRLRVVLNPLLVEKRTSGELLKIMDAKLM